MTLTKQNSDVIKGFAIILMLVHHLFGFPERAPEGLSIHPLLSTFPLEYQLGVFGQICVPLFVFLSGYSFGLRTVPTSLIPSSIWQRISRFFCVYWVNFAVLIPIGILWFPDVVFLRTGTQRFDPSWGIFFQNFVGARISYSGEWWFVRLYIILIVLVWPLVECLARLGARALIVSSLALLGLGWNFYHLDLVLIFQAIFTSGFVFSRYKVFEKLPIDWLAPRFGWSGITIGFSLLSIACLGLVRSLTSFNKCDFVLIPILIPILVRLSSELKLERLLELLGRYSAHMWLNHTFFCYYFFGTFFYGLRYPPLIFLALLLASFCLAVLTNAFAKPLLHGLDRLRWVKKQEERRTIPSC